MVEASPQPMDTAPNDGRWLLLFTGVDEAHETGWVIGARCDGGWRDEAGYGIDAIGWHALPDPQPPHSSWIPAEGEVVVEAGWIGDDKIPIWLVSVVGPDGRYDDGREPIIARQPTEAITKASDWAKRLGLPMREGNMVHAQAQVVPIMHRSGQ